MTMTKKLMIVYCMCGLILSGLNYDPDDSYLNTAYGQNFEKDSENRKPKAFSEKEGIAKKVNFKEVTVTRWKDSQDRKPISYVEWRNRVGERGLFKIELSKKSLKLKRKGNGAKFCVIVNSTLYDDIQSSVDQYVMDLTKEGYDVEVYTTSGGTPEDLRAFLQGRYSLGLVGCIFIGDLPVAWYETECWDPPEHEEFPIDLYYMDLDGTFGDSDLDGIYDSHTGDISPEIWIGRLTASTLTLGGANEVSLVQNYFYKNHLYRSGLLSLNNRALVYIDDDWVYWADEWDTDVGEAYSERTLIKDELTTIHTDYESRLPQNYEFIQICAHSSPFEHWFKIPPDEWDGYTSNSEVKAIDPLAFFYNLFACSNARYVEANYMGGWYIFCQTYGLGALGSAKTGSMLNFGNFYQPFGEGKTIGEAFCDWFSSIASGGFEEWEVCWFYGMTLLGDPTLTLKNKPTLYAPADSTIIYDITPTFKWSHTAGTGGTYTLEYDTNSLFSAPEVFDSLTDTVFTVPDTLPLSYFTYYWRVQAIDEAQNPSGYQSHPFSFTVYMCGDANNDYTLDLADVIWIANYKLKSGPQPIPTELAGDANGDCAVDLSDVVYLANYLLKGGPDPVPCEEY